MKKLFLIASAVLSALAGSTASADGLRADWMAGKRGMMVHWLFGEPGRIDYYVNGFDINKFMADFDATKSDYLIFTVGQNAGVYASPNSKITAYAGAGHCPARDLVGEIAAAVHARGKKFIAYLPCELNANTTLHEGFGWPAAGSGKDLSTFQTRWLEVITEWAIRWGSNLDGWWIDGYTDGGTHWPDALSAADEARWAAALRAGNANAVITFNNGLAKKTPRAGAILSDCLAGEINSPSALNGWDLTEFAEGTTSCRTHFLMPIDGFWGGYWSWDQAGGANPYSGRGLPNQQTMNRLSYIGQFPDPVVSESDLSAMIQSVFAVHGAVTINIGVNASGTLNPASVALLAKMPGGSESASAPKGTTVESLIGSWSSTPMASDGSTFSTDGDLVYAYSTASADKTVNGITFKAAANPASASVDFEFAPAFNTTQNAESDTMSGDLETIAKLAWKNSEKKTGGYATMTFKGLTAGRRYCIQLYIHDTYCHSSAVFGPDAKSTVIYRAEESDPKSGKDWTCGGVFTGVITAKGTTHEITLNYPTTDRVELNALQVRSLGEAGDDPEPVEANPDTSWMAGSFGVSFHWTAKIVDNYGSKNWEQAVASFDVKKFADSVESFGAQHVIFTVAHAWQKLPCPCAALDAVLTGRTTTRDLMQDIIDELTGRNIRVIFYYNHSCNHNEDSAWQAASGYNDITDEASMAAFGSKICSIVRELSLRYGDGVSAWWFDSASSVDDSEPWTGNKKSAYVNGLRFPWDNLFAAARAGNPHAAVAVNWDVGATDQHGLATDYLSGETEKIDAYGNCFPFAPEGLQDHIWTRMDSSDWFWQGGEVKNYGSRFSEEQLAWWKVSHRDAGRMATLNLVIDEAGNINPVVAEQLVKSKTLGKVWSQGRYDPTKWQAAPSASNLVLGLSNEDGTFEGPSRPGKYGLTYDKTGISVLTDGTIPTTPIVAGGNITAADSAYLFSAASGSVFSWSLKEASDIYGLNIYTRGTRVGNGAMTDGASDAIVVTDVAVKYEGNSEWTSIDVPSVLFGKHATERYGDGISGGALAACLKDEAGAPLAQNVTAVRVSFGDLENGSVILAECEVIGCKAEGGGGDDDPDLPTSGWTAIPMTSDGSVFSTDGDLVFAFSRDRGDPGTTYENSSTPVTFNYLNSLTDTVTKYHPWQYGGKTIDGPYDNGLQPADYLAASPVLNGADGECGNEGVADGMDQFGSMLKCMWTGPSLSETDNKATFTLERLTSGHAYLVEFFIHRSNESTKSITSPDGKATIYYGGADWKYGGVLRGTFVATAATQNIVLTYSDPGSYGMSAIQLRDLGEAGDEPEPPAPPPVYRLTIPAKTGLVLGSVTTNGTPVAETEGAYSVVSNTEVTITFTAASGYELDGNDGVVVKTIESDTTLADADYPAVKEQGGGGEDPDQPVDPQPGELVNGRAEMKGWSMKRISITPNGATETGFGWSAGDDPSSKSYSATESVMSFTEAQVVNTIQLFAPKSESNTIPQPVNQMPSAFKIYGSNDGSAWTELLSVSGETVWRSMECRYYTFKNEVAYSRYKLSVVSTVSGNAAKLGVYNYYFTKPADPTTPWTWDPNSKAAGFNDNGKLWRGDQQLSAWKNGNRIQLRNNSSNVNAYDLDFSAGLVDVDGNPLSYTVYLENGIKTSKFLTRIIGAAVVDAVPGWGAQYCWYLNELSLGSAFTSFGGSQAFENAYSLESLDMEQSPVEALPKRTFQNVYNLKGDLVFHVTTFSSRFNGSMITSIRLDEVVTYGDDDYFSPFEGCTCLTNIFLGANLTTIKCDQALGKIPGLTAVYWKSAPPSFTKGEGSVFNDKFDWTVTNYLPRSKKSQWEAYAAQSGGKLTLPDGDTPGTWNSGKKAYVRWWKDPGMPGLMLLFR